MKIIWLKLFCMYINSYMQQQLAENIIISLAVVNITAFKDLFTLVILLQRVVRFSPSD